LDSECGRYIDFSVISVNENSNKFQKTKFWKKKSVEDVDESTLGPTAQATLVTTNFNSRAIVIEKNLFP
jgi:hypothetical protein